MTITKCDACQKEIEKGKESAFYFGYPHYFPTKSLCGKCSAPILTILDKLHLVKIENRA